MTDVDKRRRMARRFLDDPVPPTTHRNRGKRNDRKQRKKRRS